MLTDFRALWCWGNNSVGQLGNGTTTDAPVRVRVTDANGMNVFTAISVAAGMLHTCALLVTGRVLCWGAGASGQLGDGSATRSLRAVQVTGLTDAVAIGAGAFHTCAVRVTGAVQCWGNNSFGELGNGETGGFATTPVDVSGVTDAIAVTGGAFFTCALRVTGAVRCWGSIEGCHCTESDVGTLSDRQTIHGD